MELELVEVVVSVVFLGDDKSTDHRYTVDFNEFTATQ